jgi:anaerobic selenocysteine-containing dehydrogenase
MGKTSKTSGAKLKDGASRRDFLKLASATAPAAVAAVALGSTQAEAATAVAGQPQGLQDTAHTRAYYESARF